MAKTPTDRRKPVDMPLPVKGVYRGSSFHEVPDQYTLSANNVLAYDSVGRNRPGTRPGLRKYFSFQFGGAAAQFQFIGVATVQSTTNGTSAMVIIIVCNGKAYVQQPNDGSATRIDGGGAATFVAGTVVSAVTFENTTYFTDGRVLKKYDHDAASFGNWTASAGSLPTAGSGDKYPRGLALWRGRVVLVHLDKGLSSTIFFTRQGDPTDFDYGATPVTADMAVATDVNYKAGQLGEGVTAVIPLNEDRLLVATADTLNEFVGDPADGGTLVQTSNGVGILSFYSWCAVGPAVYFLGSGGFYKYTPGTEPQCLSRFAVNEVWRNLPQVGYFTSMAYDKQMQVIWIFVTKAGETPSHTFPTLHYAYDLRAEELYGRGGFWPVSMPVDTGGDDNAAGTTAPTMDATRACSYDGFDGTNDGRCVLVAGRDGYVRTFDYTPLAADDGQAISSSIYFGPVIPAGPSGLAMVNGWLPICGEQANFNATWTLQGAADPSSAFTSPTITKTGTFTTGGRQSPRGERLAANAIYFKVENSTNNKRFAIERVTLMLEPAGPNR